jgi:hypothetical protein
MNTLAELTDLLGALDAAKKELMDVQKPRMSYEDIEDVSDAFQERLEYDYWVNEQNEYILELQQQIKVCRQGIDKESLEAYDAWNSMPEDEEFKGYHTFGGRHTWDFEESIGE